MALVFLVPLHRVHITSVMQKACVFCGFCESFASDLRRYILVDRCRCQTINSLKG